MYTSICTHVLVFSCACVRSFVCLCACVHECLHTHTQAEPEHDVLGASTCRSSQEQKRWRRFVARRELRRKKKAERKAAESGRRVATARPRKAGAADGTAALELVGVGGTPAGHADVEMALQEGGGEAGSRVGSGGGGKRTFNSSGVLEVHDEREEEGEEEMVAPGAVASGGEEACEGESDAGPGGLGHGFDHGMDSRPTSREGDLYVTDLNPAAKTPP